MTQQTNADDSLEWQRRFAAAANNRAWTLAEAAARSAQEDAEMLDAAHAARFLWRGIGTERNAARAELLLGQVHALLGNAQPAMRCAKAAFAFFSGGDSLPWEVAFAHAVLAHAACVNGDAALHALHYGKAAEAAQAITVPANRALFEATLRVVPKPG